MNRKPIQISAMSDESDYIQLFALCNDGTIWMRCMTRGRWENDWDEVSEIPQPAEEAV